MTEPNLPPIEERVSALEGAVGPLQERMGALEAAQTDTTGAADDAVAACSALASRVAPLETVPDEVASLKARVEALEPEPTPPPTPPVGLQPPTGFTYTVNPSTRVATTKWDQVNPGESVEVHEFDTDPANTYKATVAAGTNQRVSGTLQGGHNYTYALRRVKTGENPSQFTDKITCYVPAAGEPITTTAPTTTPPAGGTTGKYPTDIIPELKRWTIMGDTGSQGDPDNDFIIGREVPGKFYVQSDGGVVFCVDPNGFHSGGSKFPRWEARFQNAIPNTWNPKSAWANTTQDTTGHSLEVVLSMDTSKLSARKRGNGIQIHDGSDDVCQIMKHETLGLGFMHDDGKSWVSIDPNYVDGTKFKCKIEAKAGRILVTYNGVKKVDVPKVGSGWYWKVGAYVQSGGSSTDKEPSTARYKVVVYSIVPTGAY